MLWQYNHWNGCQRDSIWEKKATLIPIENMYKGPFPSNFVSVFQHFGEVAKARKTRKEKFKNGDVKTKAISNAGIRVE